MKLRSLSMVKLRNAALLGIVGSGAFLGGCNYDAQPADVAWRNVQQDANVGGVVAKHTIGNDVDKLLADANKSADDAFERSNSLPVKAVDQIVGDISQYLAAELPKRVQDRQFRAYLAIGQIEDNSQVKNPFLTGALDSVAAALQTNEAFGNSFRIIDRSKEEADKLLEKYCGGDLRDFQGPSATSGPAGSNQIQPEDVYVLSGKFVQMKDEAEHRITYRMLLKVVEVKKREPVIQKPYSRSWVFHPTLKKFISEAEDDAKRAEYEKSHGSGK